MSFSRDQHLIGDDSYTPGHAPFDPASSPVSNPSIPYSLLAVIQDSRDFYPIEPLEDSDPLEFVVRYPYVWDPYPCDLWSEGMLTVEECRFLDQFTWFEGEWHWVWGIYTRVVYYEFG